jgi:hypothetical protein
MMACSLHILPRLLRLKGIPGRSRCGSKAASRTRSIVTLFIQQRRLRRHGVNLDLRLFPGALRQQPCFFHCLNDFLTPFDIVGEGYILRIL